MTDDYIGFELVSGFDLLRGQIPLEFIKPKTLKVLNRFCEYCESYPSKML